MTKIKVLFVCLGNICRSPLAEALFKDKVRREGLHIHIETDSCGTGDYHIGEPPDSRTLANARRNGISIDHRCRQLQSEDLDDFHYIVAMDRSNYGNILRLADEELHREKILMMRRFDPHGPHEDVPDPYYGGERGFQEVFEILDRSTENLLRYVKENHLR